MIVESDDDVAFEQYGLSSRTVSLVRNNHDSTFDRQVIEAHDAARERHVLSRQTNVAAADLTIADQTAGDELRRINRSGKTDSLRGQDHRRIDADDFSSRINERATGITRIESGVRLNHIVHQPTRLRAQRATQSAHHACRHRVLKTIWVADSNDQLADSYLLRLTQRDRHQIVRVDSDDGEVCIRVVSN